MEKDSKDLRKICLRLSHACGDGNLQSAFSCIDSVWALYDGVMNWSVENAKNPDRDYFLISKGQATLALYSVLIKKGFFGEEIMVEIGSFGSRYCIQADWTKFDGGIENSAGSLGHGFPMAAGIAFANKIKKSMSRVFVLTGDGEFNEGTMWETCIFAAGKKLDNLCVIIDDNDSVGAMIDMGSMRKKLEGFGFDVFDANGHDVREMREILSKRPRSGSPMAVIAHTVRGYGCPTLMSDSVWFHKAPNGPELERMMAEVESQ